LLCARDMYTNKCRKLKKNTNHTKGSGVMGSLCVLLLCVCVLE
jgi:hypothetical protein